MTSWAVVAGASVVRVGVCEIILPGAPRLAEASQRPSELAAKHTTGPALPPSVRLLPLASQRRTAPSAPAEVRVLPSGVQARPLTAPLWPSRVRAGLPVSCD